MTSASGGVDLAQQRKNSLFLVKLANPQVPVRNVFIFSGFCLQEIHCAREFVLKEAARAEGKGQVWGRLLYSVNVNETKMNDPGRMMGLQGL